MHGKDQPNPAQKKSKWLGKFAPALCSAGILLSQTPVSANPMIQRLMDQAMNRVTNLVSRREDQDVPSPLVLKPAVEDGYQYIAHSSHRSHSSHSSHASHASGSRGHASHASGAGTYTPPARTSPPSVTPKPQLQKKSTSDDSTKKPKVSTVAVLKTVRLQDGSELVGRVEATEEQVTVTTVLGKFVFHADDVQSVKVAWVNSTFVKAKPEESIITLKSGKIYRGKVDKDGEATIIIVEGSPTHVEKEKVQKVEKIEFPKADWTPAASDWFWFTLRDASKVRATVLKKENVFLLKFRYGEIHAKATDILIFTKDNKKSAASTVKVEAETP